MQQKDPTRSTGYHSQRDPSLLFIGTPQRVPPPTCTPPPPTCTTTTYPPPSTSATARAMALLKVAGWRLDRPNARSRTLLLLVWSFILMRLDRRKVFFFRITKEGSFSSALAANSSRQQQHKAYRKGLGHLLLSLVTVLLLGEEYNQSMSLDVPCHMSHVQEEEKEIPAFASNATSTRMVDLYFHPFAAFKTATKHSIARFVHHSVLVGGMFLTRCWLKWLKKQKENKKKDK